MVSRRKKKQALRDSAITQNFFNQANPGVCSCCAGPCQKHATSLTDFTEPDSSTEIIRAEISSLWKEGYKSLTREQREEIRTAISSETSNKPESLLKALKLAHEHIMDVPAMADEPSSTKTFALDNLNEIAEEYDELCQKYKDEEERKVANLAGLVSNLASTASDTTQSTEDRLVAELDVHNVNIHSKVIEPLTSCLRQVQLFNVEKKFGFVEESYQALSNDDRRKRGEDVPAKVPLSFRQKLNDPFKLTESKPMESAPKPRHKKGKKKTGRVEALVELQSNYKRAIEEIQDSGKTIGNINESEELQNLTPTFTYLDVPVPEDIPDHVRQRFSDAEFAFEEFLEIREKITDQLNTVRAALVAWQCKSSEVWEAGKKHIHVMPLFREYENTRISFLAMLYLASRQEVKIVEFYNSEGAPAFPPAMKKAFKLGSMSLEEFEKDWEKRCLKLREAYPSVDHMITGIDNMMELTMKAGHPED